MADELVVGQRLLERYAAVVLSVPLENALILKQVQFVPSTQFAMRLRTAAEADLKLEEDDVNADSATEIQSDSDLDDKSFHDLSELAANLDKRAHMRRRRTLPHQQAPQTAADASGYLLRTTYDDDDPTRPPFQLPAITRTGVFGIVGMVASHNDEGIASLWKGHIACLWRNIAFAAIQTAVSEAISAAIGIDGGNEPLKDAENPFATSFLLVAGHAAAGMLCAPLELAQTRLVVQTSRRRRRKYRSTWHALTTIVSEEHGGNPLRLLFSQHLIVPALAHALLDASFHEIAGPLLINRWLGIAQDEHPLSFLACELALGIAELAVLLPVETVRRRLMCQVVRRTPRKQSDAINGIDSREFETVVAVSPTPYAGIWDCIYRIATEESDCDPHPNINSRNRRHSRHDSAEPDPQTNANTKMSFLKNISSLYRGFGARLFAGILVALVRAAVQSIEVVEMD